MLPKMVKQSKDSVSSKYDANSTVIVPSSRAEWYNVLPKKTSYLGITKQKSDKLSDWKITLKLVWW